MTVFKSSASLGRDITNGRRKEVRVSKSRHGELQTDFVELVSLVNMKACPVH